MPTFGEDYIRDQQRRYLAIRRITYGNAASNFNMRNQLTADLHGASLSAAHHSKQTMNYIAPSRRTPASLSNAFSWQLGRTFNAKQSPLVKSLSPIPKNLHLPPTDSPGHRVTWNNVPEYESLQEQALAEARLADSQKYKYKSVL